MEESGERRKLRIWLERTRLRVWLVKGEYGCMARSQVRSQSSRDSSLFHAEKMIVRTSPTCLVFRISSFRRGSSLFFSASLIASSSRARAFALRPSINFCKRSRSAIVTLAVSCHLDKEPLDFVTRYQITIFMAAAWRRARSAAVARRCRWPRTSAWILTACFRIVRKAEYLTCIRHQACSCVAASKRRCRSSLAFSAASRSASNLSCSN